MSVDDFRRSINSVSAEFVKIDKYAHTIANLKNANIIQKRDAGGVWLPCCRMGPPCSSRIMAVLERNDAHKGKELIVACSEIKYCLLSTR
jgi:hypothetical protein